MAITYPLSLPSNHIQRLTIRANTKVATVPNMFTNNMQIYEWPGQMWIADVTLPLMKRPEAGAWHAFLLALNGPSGTFLMGDPQAATPLGTVTGTPLVDGDSQSGKTLLTKGWAASQAGVLLKGDYIQIGTNLYMVLTDTNSDGTGRATLDLFPRIRDQYDDNSTIITSNTKGIWRLFDTDYQIYAVDEGHIHQINFTAFESTPTSFAASGGGS